MTDLQIITTYEIEYRIFTIRGVQVILDRDIAELYGVEVKVLNQAVKRNITRFPERYRFQLNEQETNELVTICDRFKTLKHSSVLPYAFTESGVAMLSTVLRSDIAISVSIKIMDAFVAMRKLITHGIGLVQRIEGLEQKQIETDKKIDKIFDALSSNEIVPKCGIFFDGQVFDAYALVINIIKSAKHSIVLIDNYIDMSVLTILSNKAQNVKVSILTKDISQTLRLDVQRFNQQYPPAEVKQFNLSHDRFLIIDNNDVYHLGASFKDLGKKWFVCSKMDKNGLLLLEKLDDHF